MGSVDDLQVLFDDPSRFDGLPRVDVDRRLVCLWERPTFTPARSWTVYRGRGAHLVRRVTLDHNPVGGTLEPWGSDGQVPASVWDPLQAELEALELAPLAVGDRWGLDGTISGVHRGGLFAAVRLSWWESGPPAWAPLAAWLPRAVALLEAQLPPHVRPR